MNLNRIILSVCLLPTLLFAQQRTVTGNITDSDTGEGLPGVTIAIKESSTGTITDINGDFTLQVGPEDILVVRFIGFQTQEILVGTQTTFNVAMQASVEELEEIVVVGYTAERKKDLTGAVAVVDLDDVNELPAGNIMKNIQGRVPGLVVTSDGSPGSGASVRIRGNRSLFANDPLYIIDGVQSTSGMHELNPADIESIQVLKDASAATIYGARAANGVIVITTKSAKNNQTNVELTASWTAQRFQSPLDPLNTQQRGEVFWRASVNSKFNPVSPIYNFAWNQDFNNPILGAVTTNEYVDAAQTMLPSDTRWFDEVSQTGMIRNYNLSLTRGGETGKVLMSLGYYDNDGTIKETNFQRVNLRINSDFKVLNGKLTIGENLQLSLQNETLINAGDVLFTSLVQHPIVPVYTIDGGWGGPASGMTDRQNPVRLIEDNKQNRYTYSRPFGNVFVELEPIENLKLRSSFGIDYSMFYLRNIQKAYQSGFINQPNNSVSQSADVKGSWTFYNTANYKLEKNKHSLDVLAGMEQVKYQLEALNSSNTDYVSEDPNFAYVGSGSGLSSGGGFGNAWALSSVFGKLNYQFADKYLASFTLRRDGSSRFPKNRWGNFPAASFGWRISEEGFFKNVIQKPVEVKLRVSWGQTGNNDISSTAAVRRFLSQYSKEDPIWDNPVFPTYLPNLGTAYDIAGNDSGLLSSGFILTQLPNDNLTWEITTQTNYGIDFVFIKFSGSIDYYVMDTEGLLYLSALSGAVGESRFQWVNSNGLIRNSGIEALLSYEHEIGDLKINLTGNAATLKNEIIRLANDQQLGLPLSGYIPNEARTTFFGNEIIGQSTNAIYGYVADGIFQNQDEVNAHATQSGKGVGRIRFKDLDGNGIIDTNDQKFIGSADPSFTFGFNVDLTYKRFDFSFFLQGVTGIEYYNSYKTYTDFASLWPGTNWGTRTLDAWSPTNTDSEIPALTIFDTNNEGRTSTYFVENASFLKLRNVQLGYRLPDSIIDRLKLKGGKVFIQGQNLLTIKSKEFTALDPENPNYSFPIPQMYTLGFNLNF